MIMNMAANFFGPALAWRVFFTNNEQVRATHDPSNYLAMAGWFSAVAVVFLLLMLFGTRKYMRDSRTERQGTVRREGFLKDMKGVLTDRYSMYVFLFSFIIMLSVVLISSLQIYLYEHFLKLDAGNKSIAHGGTMVAFALGSAAAVFLVSRFQKKGAVIFASVLSIACNLILAVFFLSGLLKPSDSYTFPVFVFLNSMFWFGTGIMLPITTAMIADVSELNEIKTGVNKDGTYSAMLSFAIKLAGSVATFASGLVLTWIGFNGQTENSPEVLLRLCMIALLAGPAIAAIALFAIMKYPITKDFLEKFRQKKNDSVLQHEN
jgi:GPH family glycoside/pentoside/hexuronide:cation symporter